MMQNFSSHRWLKNSIKVAGSIAIVTAATATQADFKVIGYFPSWSNNVDTLAYDKMTHINYSFVKPTADGGLQSLDESQLRKMERMVSNAHSSGIKALVAVGGWGDSTNAAFESMTANSQHRAKFVGNLLRFVDQYQFDGVDIDWEFPNTVSEVEHFKLLMQELHTALSARGKLLSAAVSQSDATNAIDSEVITSVDYLNLMAYDKRPSPHSSYAEAQVVLAYWKEVEGLPQEKAILGVPFYSRSEEGTMSYKDIIANYGNSAAWIDEVNGQDYNGIPTMRAKTQLSLAQAGGIMFWDTSKDTQDETSLMSAIWEVVSKSTLEVAYPQWERGKQYYEGDVVQFEGRLYFVEHDNPGFKPTVSTWYWEPVALWQTSQDYSEGDVVEYQGELYIAEYDNPGYNPTISTWYWNPHISSASICEKPGQWKQANLTNYESYPEAGSIECAEYSGCQWAGQFAGLEGVQPESWVAANNIAAVHEDFFNYYNGKTLQLRQGDKQINVVVYDMCADSDCDNCCTQNLGKEGFLIDIEKYTMQRFGSGSGSIDFRTCD